MSKILRFAARFELVETYPENDSYKQWIFKNAALEPSAFAENTLLQRNCKRFVLAGGKVGAAKGFLR